MADKALLWLGSSREAVRSFSPEGRREAGYQLRQVQAGAMPDDWKALPTVGAGVYEIRVRVGPEYRILYVAKCQEAVYVLHAFEKRTQQTRETDVTLARRRLAAVVAQRKRRQEGSMAIKMHRSSGNVFRDLGFPAEEAANLRVRADLMIALSRLIKARGLTQAAAARLFGVSQPRVSDLVRGKIGRFSVDTLIALLGNAGVHVEITTKRRVA